MSKSTKKKEVPSEGIKARGFYRLQIREQDGKVAGDSGWKENQVVNLGFQDYLAATLGAVAGSKQITFAMLGSGTAPGATATALDGEYTDVAAARCAVTPTTIASKTVQFAFTLASSVYTNAKTIQNVGLINHSSTATAGTIFAGNTYKNMRLIIVMLYEKLAICWKLLRGEARKGEHKRTISREDLRNQEPSTTTRQSPLLMGEDIVWSAGKPAEVYRNDIPSNEKSNNILDATSALATNQSVNGLTIWPLWLEIIISKSLKLQGQLILKVESICSEILNYVRETFNDYNRGFQLSWNME